MLRVRKTIPADLPALTALFNHTVRVGGTTAHEVEYSVAAFKAHYFDDATFMHTVLDGKTPIGFQAVFETGEGLAIGSFTDQRNPVRNQVRGAGRALFDATKAAAKAAGYPWIDAKIRADNVPGLAYYSKMGFADFKVDVAVPLADGTPVDRITKRLIL